MTQANFQTVIDKIMSDENFAAALAEKPEETLRGLGVEPTPEMVDAISGVDAQAIKQLVAAFGDKRAAAA